MDSLTCEPCNYLTTDKSNYAKHLKSVRHGKLTKSINIKSTNEFICEICGKQFAHNSSLSRHRLHRCVGGNKKSELEELKEELKEIKQMINNQFQKQQLGQKQTNVYISVKQYINDNYSSAPSLAQLEDYTVIEDDYDDFGLKLISVYNDGQLTKYLGELIIKYYKKDDPKEQSLWNSDVSRLTYIIKEIMDKSSWYKDPKGIKTREYIIDPLLNYIKVYCEQYIDKYDINCDNRRHLSGNECIIISQNQIVLGKIITDIENDILANSIIRHIAPHFVINDVKLLK